MRLIFKITDPTIRPASSSHPRLRQYLVPYLPQVAKFLVLIDGFAHLSHTSSTQLFYDLVSVNKQSLLDKVFKQCKEDFRER